MKKIITLFVFLFSFGMFLQAVQAQQISVGDAILNATSAPNTFKLSPTPYSMSVIDTLFPPIVASHDTCTTNIWYYTYTNSVGYVTGNNKNSGVFRSAEVAQRYNFSQSGTISDVLVRYAYKTGSNGVTYAKIYNVSSTTKKPTTMLDSSNTITTGLIVTTNGAYTDYFFSPQVMVSTNFAVSAVFPNPHAGDTTVVWETRWNCHSVDSLSSEQYVVDSSSASIGWYLYTYLLNSKQTTPNDTSLDLYILPVFNTISGVNEVPTSKDLSLLGAYPNPAKSFTNISYHVSKTTEATISVFDLSGKVYKEITAGVLAGDHQFQLNVSDMAAGNYFYTIKTEEAIMTSKFSVVK